MSQVADLSGELMRLAIGRISDGEVDYAKNICSFARDIYRELTLVVPLMDDNSEMKKKMEVMLQSVVKIENGITLLMPSNINIVNLVYYSITLTRKHQTHTLAKG
jgi:predicted translin family RNA/ssDNA-binding protein